MKRFLLLIGILSQITFAATQITWKDLQRNIGSWIEGPVSLIATDQEKNFFKKLKTPEEKMQFVKIFWSRRDPILRTTENEYKEEFYRRVEHANRNFADSKEPGWKTARGQVYITLGPPSREDKQIVADSQRPALLWVYDKLPTKHIPPNEALMFVYHDFKYVLLPPNPQPGDTIGAQQRAIDSGFRYQSIPTAVSQTFADAAQSTVIDEKKNYEALLYSVKSTEKFGLQGIQFEARILESHPPQIQVVVDAKSAPVYDDGEKVFAEFYFKQELKRGNVVIASNQHIASYSWDQKSFAEMKEITVNLPPLQAPAGQYELSVTMGDRISNVSETRKLSVQY